MIFIALLVAIVTHPRAAVGLLYIFVAAVQQIRASSVRLLPSAGHGCTTERWFASNFSLVDYCRTGVSTMWAIRGSLLLAAVLVGGVVRVAEGQEGRNGWPLGQPLQPDSFYVNPEDQVVERGSHVTLECIPKDLSEVVAIVWAFVDLTANPWKVFNVLTNNTERGYYLVPHGEDRMWRDLVIPSVTDRHETGYQCRVYYRNGTERLSYYSDVAELVIHEQASLKFPDGFTDVVTTPGKSVNISIEVTGTPTPSITLQKMEDGSWINIEGKRFKVNTTLISISSVKSSDGGQYQLVLSNRPGQSTTYEFSILVERNIGDLFPEPAQETPVLAIAVGVSVGVCALLAVAVLIVVLAMARRCKRASSFSPKEDSDEENEKVQPIDEAVSPGYSSSFNACSDFSLKGSFRDSPYLRHVVPTVGVSPDIGPQWMVSCECVKLKNVLSENAHMTIFKGTMAAEDEMSTKAQSVAAKTIKDPSNEGDLEDLFHEMQLMSQLAPHSNVIKLLGVITQGPQYMLLMECMTHGDLLGFLRATRSFHGMYSLMPGCGGDSPCPQVTSQDLLRIAVQVANGMSFLEENKIVHKALCARNVLVGSNMQVKVFNYSSRNPETCRPANYYRWMAPETFIDNVFDNKSDVWSFGVTLWEIVTVGGCPYMGMNPTTLLQKLQNGYKLLQPEHVSGELYYLMLSCWDKQTPKRPHFSQLSSQLDALCESQRSYIDLRMYDSEQYSQFDDLQQFISTL